jgi:Tetratricopeptide repeat/PEGA domain
VIFHDILFLMHRRRSSRIILLLVLLSAAGWAQPSPAGVSTVFITTRPMGAVLLVNGERVAGESPILLRDLPSGSYELTILKTNRPPMTVRAEVPAGEVLSFSYTLPADRFVPAPYETSITLNGQAVTSGEKGISLPEGSYSFSWDDGTLDIRPAYPFEGTIRTLDILTPSVLILAAVLMGEELVWNQERYFSVSPFSTGLAAAGGVLGILDLRLRARRNEYVRGIDPLPVGRESADGEARLLYDEAREELGLGRTAEAARTLERLISRHGDSELVPEALYTLGRIHLIRGERALAAAEFKLILEKYPHPDVFDRTCRALADFYALEGDFRAAATALESIVYIDKTFKPEEIEALANSYLEQEGAE